MIYNFRKKSSTIIRPGGTAQPFMHSTSRISGISVPGISMLVVFLLWGFAIPSHAAVLNSGIEDGPHKTMLMFVGEDLDVLTIATRREESAVHVPAVAQVITRQQIRDRGFRTLSEALSLVPGFYMAEKEGGTHAYLRGISGSVLFLYDTVPLGSEVTKSLQFLDYEISLNNVKRIEIIRGPGSVLWGPDAFAGVVNIVPLSGADLNGSEAGALVGSPGKPIGGFANIGKQSGSWDTSFSVSARKGQMDDRAANIAQFWGDQERAVPPEERKGHAEPEDAHYIEATGRVARGEYFSISGRISNCKNPYAIADQETGNSWIETKNVSSGFVKLEGKHDLHYDSAIRFSGSFRWIEPEYEIIDRSFKQKDRTSYAELIYDKTVQAGDGQLTLGLSHRDNHVENAPIWNSYFPDYLGEGNDSLLPLLEEVDYETRLFSFFGQYSQKLGPVDMTAGLRYDDHDKYNKAASYNVAAVWTANRNWAFKLLHGTAFRTPYASQLWDQSDIPDPEKIVNSSIQVTWKSRSHFESSLTVFHNAIDQHVNEDHYAGLSEPISQMFWGMEMDAGWRFEDVLEIGANLTMIDNSGTDETYRYGDYSYIDENGQLVEHTVELVYPYDTGAKRMANLFAIWRPFDFLSVSPVLRYIGTRDLIYPRSESITPCDDVWLADLSVTIHHFFHPQADLSIYLKNLLDQDYTTPGTYSLINGKPFTTEVLLRWRW